ncbi:Tub-domain-containing protein [Gonapodya prolifera JEL478]|uniref:Tub-domain-containing protein n=1 Tax=Gonapodya prolifera (strain JEL478) TaxID=1344416 RepID=A0A139AUF1_GONPJ|nr:Tub-domain-containing protein [Gonapodya prolifera JEL478]|eukprot:KXS20334.1 Tub-domain-containing protein [Gonapodya prolifera JEL478]
MATHETAAFDDSGSEDDDIDFAPIVAGESSSAAAAPVRPSLPQAMSEEVLNAPVAPLPATATATAAAPTVETVSFDRRWIMNPVPQGKKVLCKIVRHKEGIERIYPSYELFIEEPDESLTFVLAARKRKKSKSSNYVITTTRITSTKAKENVVAKVRSNFLGTEFTVYDDGRNPSPRKESRSRSGSGAGSGSGSGSRETQQGELRAELAAVLYEHNILGFKGPRKVRVLLPGMSTTGDQIVIRPEQPTQTLISRYRHTKDPEILELHNKSPQWNEETQSYVLNFNGRVQLASVKNFQVVSDHDRGYECLGAGKGTDA